MASSPPRPLRILCIHGYCQNAGTFREKTGALRKALKRHAELVYINAPHQIGHRGPSGSAPAAPLPSDPASPSAAPGGPGEDGRGWWFSDPRDRSFSAEESCASDLGLDESLEAVRRAVGERGPFDGVLGFSQGAALVAMLCARQERGQEPGPGFRFAVLVAGFRSRCAGHAPLYTAPPLGLPTLHVLGDSDRVIPAPLSRDLLPVFRDPVVVTHPGGHYVPAGAAQKQAYIQFLEQFTSS
ncbi:esterase OVCA2 [Lepisosteus oculatus]|uniref:esterase OVCA2 n=1 Tax=Lepisosteus oculatus TaxID=7918 RepID=UPI00371AC115